MKIVKLVEKCLCSVSILLTSVISFSAIALPVNAQQSMTLSAGECFVVVASRQFLYEVSEFLNGLDDGFTDVRVFKSTNDWYAISVGKVPSNVSAGVISSLVASNRIPSDSICSTGKSYLREMDITELKQPQKKNPKATEYRGELTLLTDLDLFGQDLTPDGLRGTNLIDCLLYCKSDAKCRSLTHDTGRNICYLKTHTDSNNVIGVEGLVSILLPSTQNTENKSAQAEYLADYEKMLDSMVGSDDPDPTKIDTAHSAEAKIIQMLSKRPHCYHLITDGAFFTSIFRIDVFSDGTFCKARYQEVFGEKNEIDYDPTCKRQPIKFVQQLYRNTGEKYWLGGSQINSAPGVWPQFIIDNKLETIRMVDGYHPFLQDNTHYSRECSYYEYDR
jgi:hypothetical protein